MGGLGGLFTGMHYTIGGRVVRGWGCSIFLAGGMEWRRVGGGQGCSEVCLTILEVGWEGLGVW